MKIKVAPLLALIACAFVFAQYAESSVLLKPTACFDLSQKIAIDYMKTNEAKEKLGIKSYSGLGVIKAEYVGTNESNPIQDVHEISVSYGDGAWAEEIARLVKEGLTEANLEKIGDLERRLNAGLPATLEVRIRAPLEGEAFDCSLWEKAGVKILGL